MHLAARRHVDDDVAQHPCRARQPASRRPAARASTKRCSDSLTSATGSPPRSARRAWRTRPRRPAPGSARTCARPPQTESMSTPRLRAACRSGVPCGKWPRLPEGVKTTRASRCRPCVSASPSSGADGRLRGGRAAPRAPGRDARLTASAPAGGGLAKSRIQRAQSGSWPIITSAPMHRLDHLDVHRVGDRGGQPGGRSPWSGTPR